MSASELGLGRKSALTLVAFALLGLLCTACGTISPQASFKSSVLPFEISIGASGNSTIEGNISWVTDIGQFSIGAQYELPPRNNSSIYVILRNHHTGYDKIYEVRTDGEQFNAIVNGTTSITVTNDQVLIDVTNGNTRSLLGGMRAGASRGTSHTAFLNGRMTIQPSIDGTGSGLAQRDEM